MSDRAFDLAYECHRKYLDSDSADCSPIEDYIAEAIRRAVAELEAERDRLRSALSDMLRDGSQSYMDRVSRNARAALAASEPAKEESC